MMKRKRLWVAALLFMLTLLSASMDPLVSAFAPALVGGYRRIVTINGPGIPPHTPKWAFDISWMDGPSQRYYLADASNASVDIFDARTNTFLGCIPGFTGFHDSIETQGLAGLVTDTPYQLWVGDGNSTVKVIDLFIRTIVATISTGGTKRADERAYDPHEQLLLVTNGSNQPPFMTFISVLKHKVVGKIVFPQVLDGSEAPLWDGVTHKFYVSVPTTSSRGR